MVLGTVNLLIQYRTITEYNQKLDYEKGINKNYILSGEEVKSLENSRQLDILERGNDHPVYNLDGKTVKLINACLWHNNGKYVVPKTSRIDSCTIS